MGFGNVAGGDVCNIGKTGTCQLQQHGFNKVGIVRLEKVVKYKVIMGRKKETSAFEPSASSSQNLSRFL